MNKDLFNLKMFELKLRLTRTPIPTVTKGKDYGVVIDFNNAPIKDGMMWLALHTKCYMRRGDWD